MDFFDLIHEIFEVKSSFLFVFPFLMENSWDFIDLIHEISEIKSIFAAATLLSVKKSREFIDLFDEKCNLGQKHFTLHCVQGKFSEWFWPILISDAI